MSDESNLSKYPVSVGAAQSFVEGELGGPVTEKETSFSLSTDTVTKLTNNNPERVSLTIVNTGDNAVSLAVSDSVSSSFGIIIGANGGFLSLTIRDDQMLPIRDWYAYSSGAVSSLYVIELYRYALT